MNRSFRPVIVFGPSGSGKSVLLKKLFTDLPTQLGFSVSHTTRSPRPNEINAQHYHFIDLSTFQSLIERKEFIEYATFSGHMYGTSFAAVQTVIDSGKICVLDIDMQGVKSVKASGMNPLVLFVRPPSLSILEQRLKSRGTESEQSIKLRIETAAKEMEFGLNEGVADRIVLNDDLEVAGCGKSTLLNRLLAEFPNVYGFSVSHTTRQPRKGEVDGVNYHFVTRERFEELVKNGAFLEHAEFSGNRYGTSFKAIQSVTNAHKVCILDIDTQGVKNVKAAKLNVRCLFIKPPSLQVLEKRLRGRGTETEDSLNKRLSYAKKEIAYGEEVADKIVLNDDVDVAFEELKVYLKKGIYSLMLDLLFYERINRSDE